MELYVLSYDKAEVSVWDLTEKNQLVAVVRERDDFI